MTVRVVSRVCHVRSTRWPADGVGPGAWSIDWLPQTKSIPADLRRDRDGKGKRSGSLLRDLGIDAEAELVDDRDDLVAVRLGHLGIGTDGLTLA